MIQELEQIPLWDTPDVGVLIVGLRGVGKTTLSRKLVQLWHAHHANSRKGSLVVRLASSGCHPDDPDELPLGSPTLQRLASASILMRATQTDAATLCNLGFLVPENRSVTDWDDAKRLLESYNSGTHNLCLVQDDLREHHQRCVLPKLGRQPGVTAICITQSASCSIRSFCRRHFSHVFFQNPHEVLRWNNNPAFELCGNVRAGDFTWVLFRRVRHEPVLCGQ